MYKRLHRLYYVFISRKHTSLDLFSHAYRYWKYFHQSKGKGVGVKASSKKKSKISLCTSAGMLMASFGEAAIWSSKVSWLRLSSSKQQLQPLRTWDTSPAWHNLTSSAGLLLHWEQKVSSYWWESENAHLSPVIKSQIFLVALVVKNQWVK